MKAHESPEQRAREAIRQALVAHRLQRWPALPGRTNHLEAGVLLPLRVSSPGGEDARIELIATERRGHLGLHAGEVCFPGGRPEPGDRDLAATALREAAEEVGIRRAEVLGRLSSMPLYTSDYRLVPFVAAIEDEELVPEPGEVERVLVIEIQAVLARPHIDAVPWEHEGARLLAPVFDVGAARPMFGATAQTFLELLYVVAPALGARVPTLEAGRYTWPELLGNP